MPFDPMAAESLFLSFRLCQRLRRVYISDFHLAPTGLTLRSARRQLLGSYVISIDDTPIFGIDDIQRLLLRYSSQDHPPATLLVTVAPERASDFDDRPPPLHLRLHDLRHIAALQSLDGVGMPINVEPSSSGHLRTVLNAFKADLHGINMVQFVHRLQHAGMTEEERSLKRFTRRQLMRLRNWPEWDKAFDAQLDAHLKVGCIGTPVPRPLPTDDRPLNVLRIHWTNTVKTGGTHKAHACIDGSRRAAPWLRLFAQTYASCIEQPCMHLFFALAAVHGLIVIIADTTNAFQQSPPPMEQCFLQIDDAYHSWYKKHFSVDIDPITHVVPLNKALQGHPEAGALWEHMIVSILEDKLGFRSTTHERNLYRGEINGELLLVLCHQVDDFAIAIATKDPRMADILIDKINAHVTTQNKGISTKYNGVNLLQTCSYIKLSCKSFIDQVV